MVFEVNQVAIIRTERLLLRDFNETDWQSVHDYASDREVVRYMDWGPNTEEETKSFIRRSIAQRKEQPRRHYTLAVTLKTGGRLIGGCGLQVTNPDNRQGYLGYCLNRHYWRRGYATETANALLKFGFQQLSLHRIFAESDPANTASVHVLEKIGMQREGHIREHRWAKGKWRDSLLYAILETE